MALLDGKSYESPIVRLPDRLPVVRTNLRDEATPCMARQGTAEAEIHWVASALVAAMRAAELDAACIPEPKITMETHPVAAEFLRDEQLALG